MSLSRRERGRLNAIGRQLLKDDPQLAARLGRPPRPASNGWFLAGAALLMVTGFVILMLGAVLMSTELGAAGFVTMAAGGTLASRRIDPPQLRWVKRPPNPEVRHNTSVE
ncbi:MAG TPA: DUF3040 domain-containing protein [Arthrobacter sp.]|nr:DUF3040 domain-containing protein [Arthrobacter sp.]